MLISVISSASSSSDLCLLFFVRAHYVDRVAVVFRPINTVGLPATVLEIGSGVVVVGKVMGKAFDVSKMIPGIARFSSGADDDDDDESWSDDTDEDNENDGTGEEPNTDEQGYSYL